MIYTAPDVNQTYVLIDDKFLYISDPCNTPRALEEEECIYDQNGQTFEVIDKDNKQFSSLKIPSNIKTLKCI